MDARSAPRSKSTSLPEFFCVFLQTPIRSHAKKTAASRNKPPREICRSGYADTLACFDIWRRERMPQRSIRIREEIPAMKSSINPQSASELARAGAEIFERRHVAAAAHFLDSPRWFQSTNQNKAILASASHKKVQQPVHSIVQIHIRSPRRHLLHKLPRGRPGKSMTRLIVANGIRLCLDDHAPAAVPNQLATDQLARTSQRIALKEFGLNFHAADSVKSRPECSIFACAKTLSIGSLRVDNLEGHHPAWPQFPSRTEGPDRQTPLSQKPPRERPPQTPLRGGRMVHAGKWTSRGNAPEWSCGRWLSVMALRVLIPEIRRHSEMARLRRR